MPGKPTLHRIVLIAVALQVLALPVLADTTVTFIDVGQGDAIWIHDDTGHDVLIDAGERDQGSAVLSHLRGVPNLDVVLWTHAHADHIGGLIDVVAEKPVGQVLYNGFDYDSATFNDLWGLIVGYSIPASSTRTGDTFTWGECTATVLHPDREYVNTNDNSVVVKLSCGEIDSLLTGDAEWDAESAMLASGADLGAEILKVAHHGSISSSHSAFLDAVQPQTAIICVGADNPYGHPSSVVLGRLADRGVSVYRTDEDGTITVRTDGTTYKVIGEAPTTTPSHVYLPLMIRMVGAPPTPTLIPTEPTGVPSETPTATATPSATPTGTPTPTPSAMATPTATDMPQPGDVQVAAWCSQFDAPSDDTQNLTEEYVCFENVGGSGVGLGGWKVQDAAGATYTFPSFTLAGDATVRLRTGSGTNTQTDVYWGRGQAVWNNGGDTVYLYDGDGSLIDQYTY